MLRPGLARASLALGNPDPVALSLGAGEKDRLALSGECCCSPGRGRGLGLPKPGDAEGTGHRADLTRTMCGAPSLQAPCEERSLLLEPQVECSECSHPEAAYHPARGHSPCRKPPPSQGSGLGPARWGPLPGSQPGLGICCAQAYGDPERLGDGWPPCCGSCRVPRPSLPPSTRAGPQVVGGLGRG